MMNSTAVAGSVTQPDPLLDHVHSTYEQLQELRRLREHVRLHAYHVVYVDPVRGPVCSRHESKADLLVHLKQVCARGEGHIFVFEGERHKATAGAFNYLHLGAERIPLYDHPDQDRVEESGALRPAGALRVDDRPPAG